MASPTKKRVAKKSAIISKLVFAQTHGYPGTTLLFGMECSFQY